MDLGMKKWVYGLMILAGIVLTVVLFADIIVPTLSSTPVRFDITEPIVVNTNLP